VPIIGRTREPLQLITHSSPLCVAMSKNNTSNPQLAIANRQVRGPAPDRCLPNSENRNPFPVTMANIVILVNNKTLCVYYPKGVTSFSPRLA
jgi:hypothetical protein